MMKKILATSLVVSALMFSACSDDGEGERQLQVQQMLDQGDYTGVINALGDGNSPSEYMLLGAAYMGKAGVALPDLIEIVIDSADSNDSSTFGTFVDALSAKTKNNPDSLADLERSSELYNKVMDKNCTGASILSTSEKDVCLYIGLSGTVKAATTISYITDDVSILTDSTNGVDNKLKASACAMQYAFDGSNGGCTIVVDSNVTFVDSNKTYENIDVSTNGETFEYLIEGITPSRTPAVTNGFCALSSFDTFVDDKNASTYDPLTFYVCPVDRSNDANVSISITSVLVDALNDGTDAIGSAATVDMKESIDEFKCEILGGTYSTSSKTCSGATLTDNVTEANIIKYLNDNNK